MPSGGVRQRDLAELVKLTVDGMAYGEVARNKAAFCDARAAGRLSSGTSTWILRRARLNAFTVEDMMYIVQEKMGVRTFSLA